MKHFTNNNLPEYLLNICEQIRDQGFQVYLVGGAVRDLLLGLEPKDFDLASDAMPWEIKQIFHQVIDFGQEHGTVTILTTEAKDIEITTFRGDGHNLLDDLSKRDFTINAIAYDPFNSRLYDPWNGITDLQKNLVRSVGSSRARFAEDPLRMMRALRIGVERGFQIESEILREIQRNSTAVNICAVERIRVEFNRILLSSDPVQGVQLLSDTGLLQEIIPELEACVGIAQRSDYHRYDVFNHIIQALKHTPSDLILRLAVLFHDIGKPSVVSMDEVGVIHFYQHEKISGKIAYRVLQRLRYSANLVTLVIALVENHLRQVIESDRALRKLISTLGSREQAIRFANLRFADRIAGRGNYAKEKEDYDNLLKRIERIFADKQALKITDLAIGGNDVMDYLQLTPGPMVGKILQVLLDKVLEDPGLNQREKLLKMLSAVMTELSTHISL